MEIGIYLFGFGCGMLFWWFVLELHSKSLMRTAPEWLIEAASVDEAINAAKNAGFVPGVNCTGIRATQHHWRKNAWAITIEYKINEQPAT